jgi:hypothetical protein
MSKKNDNTILPEPDKITPVEINTINTMLPMDYEALEYVSWFMTDSQNVQNWAGNIFKGGIDTTDPRLVSLLSAANKSIKETEDDIAKIKECLAKITPTT